MPTLPDLSQALPADSKTSVTMELSHLAADDQHIVLLTLFGHEFGGVLLECSDYAAAANWVNRLSDMRRACGWESLAQRLPLNCGYEQLVGGIDVMSTLMQAHPTHYKSVLARADQTLLIVPSPERQSRENLHALYQALDSGRVNLERARVCVIANVHREEAGSLNTALIDRLAFYLAPVSAEAMTINSQPDDHADDYGKLNVNQCANVIAAASHRSVQLTSEQLHAICLAAVEHGIDSMRATLHCARVARASAALAGRDTASDVDIGLAMSLCLAWRAAVTPPMTQDERASAEHANPDPASDDIDTRQSESTQNRNDDTQREQVDPGTHTAEPDSDTESVTVSLPEKLISAIANTQREAMSGHQAGGRIGRQVHKAQRGRLVGIDRYRAGSGQRINILATLREATPWQAQRRKDHSLTRPVIYPQDLRASRYKQAAHTVVIFAVDASGSAAAHRLAEAKGAVERLLAECYERRDQVALIVFQGAQATLVLPPTRSLVRARRELSQFPSGGGTPLPSALDLVKEISIGIRKHGHTPLLCLLTDGRANVDRDGIGGRARAAEQSLERAQSLRVMGVQSLVIDIATRSTPLAGKLAKAMHGQYMALPRANAASISAAVVAAKSAAPSAAEAAIAS